MSTKGHVPVYVTEDERDGNVAIHKINKTSMVGIVKWLRPRVVAPVYVGSNPTTHPTFYQNAMTLGYRQAVRQRILIPSCAGSNPATLANPAT